ncbi:MAG: LamG domain-containing protein, partial [Methylovulum sp.]|nr:LamG domain-containing protein [Methylovulum sp.]
NFIMNHAIKNKPPRFFASRWQAVLIVFMLALGMNGWANAGLNDGLVAYWSFDDCTAKDNSGNGHDGVITDSLPCSTSKNGKAVYFDGTGSIITVSNTQSLKIDNKITISALVSIDQDNPDAAQIVQKGQSGTIWDYGLGAYYSYPSYRSWEADWFSTDTQTLPSKYGQYHLLTAVVDENNPSNPISTYLDGVKITGTILGNQWISTSNQQYGFINQSDYPLVIGVGHAGDNYKGYIDELRIYNRALTAAEVTALYQQGVVPKDNPVFNSIKFIAETIVENKIDDAISTIPNMVGFLANHPYFKNTKIFKIGINGKIGTQLQKQIREKFTGIDVTHMVADEIVDFLIDATSDAVAKATNNRYYGGATWFLMKQMYSLADAYSTSKNSKGLVPLPVAFLSTQSSLLIEVAQKDIKEFITLQKDFSGAKASEIRGVIIRARAFDLLSFYQDYFRAETQEEKAIILNDIATRQEGLLQGYLSGDDDHIFIPRVSKIAKRVYADWLKHLPGNLIKEEFEHRVRLHTLVYYQSAYDTAINAATAIFGTPIFAIDLIREKAQTDEGANNYLIEHGY